MVVETQELAQAVATWLHYKSLVGLRGLLKESSMAVPIAEFLAAKHGADVRAEVAHPSFDTKLGRPRQIDFVRVRRSEKTWHSAYETKFQTQDYSAIVSDICRLLCLSNARSKIGTPFRYLVYAANTESSERVLENYFNTGDGNREAYFDNLLLMGEESLNKPRPVKLDDLKLKQHLPFKAFAKDYKTTVPSSLTTELVGWCRSEPFICAVWKVLATKGAVWLTADQFRKEKA